MAQRGRSSKNTNQQKRLIELNQDNWRSIQKKKCGKAMLLLTTILSIVYVFRAIFPPVASGTVVVCENNTRVLGRRGVSRKRARKCYHSKTTCRSTLLRGAFSSTGLSYMVAPRRIGVRDLSRSTFLGKDLPCSPTRACTGELLLVVA